MFHRPLRLHHAMGAVASLDGSISGWESDLPDESQAVTVVAPSADRSYTGLALAQMNGGNFLYAANSLAGTVDVFDSNYQPVTLGDGAFAPGDNPDGLTPFNVQNIGGLIHVTYAPPESDEPDAAGLGTGFVNVYNPDGTFVRRIESDQFASPWGMTLAPDDFGDFLGTLLADETNPLNIPYLWGLSFGNGVLSDEQDLYFAAGIGDEEHGLFGEIAAGAEQAPEPGTLGTLLLGMFALRWSRRSRSCRA